ncbi:glycosyl transferase [Bacillus phage SP-15]|uniref:Glycosyl transferase n=1 Tax=Bacillus phage SP-15 TaxID=1792032 RepID=A0A127AWG9_9CAUD|nr:glycosyl transferase [Bacillus phage SP-15]AMM44950.1 glycosyl transferase [Bacillus phage SP-15]
MKVGIINNMNVPKGGTATYFRNYLIPLLLHAGAEVTFISYKGLGDYWNDKLPEDVKVLNVSHENFDEHIAELNGLDVIHTVIFHSYVGKKGEHIELWDDLTKLNVPLVTTVHAVTQLMRWSHDPSVLNTKSFLAHPNLAKVIQFRYGYYDLLMGKFAKKYKPEFKLPNREDYIVHHPYVGYVDRSNLIPWEERPNNISYAGRFSGAKRGYVLMDSYEYIKSFDKMVVATNYDDCSHWDRMKLNTLIEQVGDKLDLIKEFEPTDVPKIANKAKFVAFPVAWEDIEFPNEWMYQEMVSCGVIPITTDKMIKRVPDELKDVLVLTHAPTTKPVDYDAIVGQYSQEQLKEMSDKLVDYANRNWHDIDLASKHLVGVYEQAIDKGVTK